MMLVKTMVVWILVAKTTSMTFCEMSSCTRRSLLACLRAVQ
jgi:hypothetical protein